MNYNYRNHRRILVAFLGKVVFSHGKSKALGRHWMADGILGPPAGSVLIKQSQVSLRSEKRGHRQIFTPYLKDRITKIMPVIED